MFLYSKAVQGLSESLIEKPTCGGSAKIELPSSSAIVVRPPTSVCTSTDVGRKASTPVRRSEYAASFRRRRPPRRRSLVAKGKKFLHSIHSRSWIVCGGWP